MKCTCIRTLCLGIVGFLLALSLLSSNVEATVFNASTFQYAQRWTISFGSNRQFVYDNTTVNFTSGRTLNCQDDVRLYQNVNGGGYKQLLFNATGKYVSGGFCLGAVFKTTANISSAGSTSIEINYGNATPLETTGYFDTLADDFNRTDSVCTTSSCTIASSYTDLLEDAWRVIEAGGGFANAGVQLGRFNMTMGSTEAGEVVSLHNFSSFPSIHARLSFDNYGSGNRQHLGFVVYNNTRATLDNPTGIKIGSEIGGGTGYCGSPNCHGAFGRNDTAPLTGSDPRNIWFTSGQVDSATLYEYNTTFELVSGNYHVLSNYSHETTDNGRGYFVAPANITNLRRGVFVSLQSQVDSPATKNTLSFDDLCLQTVLNAVCYIEATTKGSVGAEEQSSITNDLTIKDSAVNNTVFWANYNKNLRTNATVVNATTNATVNRVFFEIVTNKTGFNLQPISGTSNGGIYSFNNTTFVLPHGNYTIKQFAEESVSNKNKTNSTAYVSIEVRAGFNITDKNYMNNSDIPNYNLEAKNSSYSIVFAGKNNVFYLPYDLAPQGSVTLTAYKDGFTNGTLAVTSDSQALQFITLNQTRNQEFKARDSIILLDINTFTLVFDNTTFSVSNSTTNGKVIMPLNQLPQGVTVLSFSASGYNTTNFTETFTANSEFNKTYDLAPSGLTIRAYEERNASKQINFGVSISNGTNTTTYNDQFNFDKPYSDLPQGDVTIDVSNSSYQSPRRYYTTISPNLRITLNAYLLGLTEGNSVRFHIRTSGGAGIVGALVTGLRFINNSYVAVAQQKTDDAGVSTLFLDPTVTYQIKVEAISYPIKVVSIQPTSPDYTIYLDVNATTFTTAVTNTSISLTPEFTGLNRTITIFTCTVSSPIGDLTFFGLNVSNASSTLYSNIISGSPSGGSIPTSIDLNGQPNIAYHNITANCFFKKSGFDLYELKRTYFLYNVNVTNSSLPSAIGNVGGLGISTLGLTIISLVITAITGGFIGRRNLIAGAVVGLIVMGVIWFYLGLFDIAQVGFTFVGVYTLVALTLISFVFIRSNI